MAQTQRQPLKTLYIIYVAASLVFVKVPIWFLRYSFPSQRPRQAWTLKRAMVIRTIRELLASEVDFLGQPNRSAAATEVPDNGLVDAKFVFLEPVPDEIFCGEIRRVAGITGVQPAKIAGYWLLKKDSEWSGAKAKPGEKTLLHMHGGGFHLGTANPSYLTANLTRGLLQHSGALERTLAVDYRLSASAPDPPSNPFPAALLDALAAYRYLVQDVGFDPANITVAGDSAGGNIAVALVLHLIENPATNLPLPGRLLVASAWLDLAASRRHQLDSSLVLNVNSDVLKPEPDRIFGQYGVTSILGPMDFEVAKTYRYLSPVSVHCEPTRGLFKGFPETYVVAGGAELLLDDSRVLAEMMKADGVAVIEDYPPDAVHDFLTMTFHEPERTEVLQRIANWVDMV